MFTKALLSKHFSIGLCCLLLLLLSSYAAAQNHYTNIESMHGWQSCTVCAGQGGHGPAATYGMQQYQRSPSLNGNSTRFYIGGRIPYSDALLWKQLGGNASAHNFTYDLWFYMTDPAAPQALEFDVNQSVNGVKYVFSTECDTGYGHTWRVWDTKNWKWINTWVSCTAPSSYRWHHLVLQFQRASNGDERYISETLDGNTHYFNVAVRPRPQNAWEINVAFQMDGNYRQQSYSVWLNKVNLTYW